MQLKYIQIKIYTNKKIYQYLCSVLQTLQIQLPFLISFSFPRGGHTSESDIYHLVFIYFLIECILF